ncbi:MAG: AraC family transcriptional regulator [Bradyrhizobium sp.]
MSTLEAALRGGAIAILLLTVSLYARDLLIYRISRYSALLRLCAAAFIIESAPGFDALDLRWRMPIHVVSSSAPVMFWILTAALFNDEFRARWYHALAWLGLATLAWWQMFGWPRSLVAAYDALALLCVLFAIWHALAGRATDLVEWRRRLRVEFAVCVALYITAIVVSQWLWPGILGRAPFSLINAIVLVGLFFLFSLRLTKDRLALSSPPASSVQSRADDSRPAPPATGQEAALLDALRRLMEDGKAYREDALSIASLSQSLGVLEYRLRRLINGQLGHRNFSAFVNGYRLNEVVAALADPSQAEVPILTIALDAGFGSIGPFNRAFKAHTGRTPTEYRRAHLGGAEGALPIPESAVRRIRPAAVETRRAAKFLP